MQKIFYFFFSFLLLFVLTITVYGQNNLLTPAESGFEFSPFRGTNDDCGGVANPSEFGPGNLTQRWRNAHSSPNLFGVNACSPGAQPAAHGGNMYVLMSGPPDERVEGIFMNLSFSSDKYYTISFWARQGSRINLKLTNGLIANICTINNCRGNVDYPQSPTDSLVLYNDVLVIGSGWQRFEISINPPRNFSQIYFHCTQSPDPDINNSYEFLLDDVVIVENCCLKQAKYQDTIDPPSTYRFELIEAGSYVFPNQFNGPVYFTMPYETVWQAGETDVNGVLQGEIVLKDGFSSGDNFHARLHDCLSTEMQVNLRHEVQPLQVGQTNCFIKIFADVCFSNGNMTYSVWNLTTGQQVTAVITTPKGITITDAPSTETEYEITVTDNASGSSVVKRIKVGRCGCLPPKDVVGVNRINTVCGPSAVEDCFKIGMDLPPNTAFTWAVSPPSAYSYITDPSSSVTTVCIPPSLSGTGNITFKLYSQNPGCPVDSNEFNIFYKRVPDNNCLFYNGFWGPTDLNDSNKLVLGFNLGIDVETVYIELYQQGNPIAIYDTDLVRGVDFSATGVYYEWQHYFGNAVTEGFPYTVVMKYKCRCSSIINIGRIRNINF